MSLPSAADVARYNRRYLANFFINKGSVAQSMASIDRSKPPPAYTANGHLSHQAERAAFDADGVFIADMILVRDTEKVRDVHLDVRVRVRVPVRTAPHECRSLPPARQASGLWCRLGGYSAARS